MFHGFWDQTMVFSSTFSHMLVSTILPLEHILFHRFSHRKTVVFHIVLPRNGAFRFVMGGAPNHHHPHLFRSGSFPWDKKPTIQIFGWDLFPEKNHPMLGRIPWLVGSPPWTFHDAPRVAADSERHWGFQQFTTRRDLRRWRGRRWGHCWWPIGFSIFWWVYGCLWMFMVISWDSRVISWDTRWLMGYYHDIWRFPARHGGTPSSLDGWKTGKSWMNMDDFQIAIENG